VNHLNREVKRYLAAKNAEDVAYLTVRTKGRPRSSSRGPQDDQLEKQHLTRRKFDSSKCIFCPDDDITKKGEKLINCTMAYMGQEIQKIIKASGNQIWQVRIANVLSSGDLLS
jgi:hypothetical protein